jgi:hypothetical protein
MESVCHCAYLSFLTTWNSRRPCSSSFLTHWSLFTKPRPD